MFPLRDMRSFHNGEHFKLANAEIAFALFNGTVSVLCLTTQTVRQRVEHESEQIGAFAFGVDGGQNTLFTATRNGLVRRVRLGDDWRGAEVQALHRLARAAPIELALAGARLLALDADGRLCVLAARDLRPMREARLGAAVGALRLSGARAFVCTRKRAVVAYDFVKGDKPRALRLSADASPVDVGIVDARQRTLLVLCSDGRMFLADRAKAVSEVGRFEGVSCFEVVRVRRATFLLFGYESGAVELHKFTANNSIEFCVRKFDGNRRAILSFAVSADSRRFFASSDDGTVWPLKLQIHRGEVTLNIDDPLIGLNGHITNVCFIDSDNLLVCSNSENVRLHNIATGRARLLVGHEAMATVVALSGDRLVTGDCDGRVLLWRRGDDGFALEKRYRAHVGAVEALTFGGKRASAFASAGADGVIKLWDLERGTARFVPAPVRELNALRISPDGALLAVAGHDSRLFLFATADLKRVAEWPAHEKNVWDVDFSPRGALASCSSDHSIRVWTPGAAPTLERALDGHLAAVLRVRFFREGLQLASAAADGSVRLWSLRRGVCVFSTEALAGRVWALDVCEAADAPARLVAGDNADGLLVFEDCSAAAEERRAAEERAQATAADGVDLRVERGEFDEAIALAFAQRLPRQFFNAVGRLYASARVAAPFVYAFDASSTREAVEKREANAMRALSARLSAAIAPIVESEPLALFALLRNNVFGERAFEAQLALSAALSALSPTRAESLRSLAKANGEDFAELINVLKIFTERNAAICEQNLKESLCVDFALKASIDK